MRRSTRFAIALIAPVACSPGADEPPVRAVLTDSSGVRIVSFDRLLTSDAPLFQTTDRFSSSTSGVVLHGVTAARLLADGSLVLANSGSSEVLRFSGNGELMNRIGRSGEGPGEFRALTALDVQNSGSLLAYDARLGRLSVFDVDGTLIETRTLHGGSATVDLVPLAYGADGSVLATYGAVRHFGAPGIGGDSVPLLRLHQEAVDRDTLGYWRGQEWAYARIAIGSARAPLAFSREVTYAGRNGRVVIGSTDRVDLTVLSLVDSLTWRIRSPELGESIPAATIRKWREDARPRLDPLPLELRNLVLENIPARYPAYGAVALDDQGRVWIARYPVESEETRRWYVVTERGEIAGSVSLPRRSHVLDVAHGRIAILDRTELDEESVRVAALVQNQN